MISSGHWEKNYIQKTPCLIEDNNAIGFSRQDWSFEISTFSIEAKKVVQRSLVSQSIKIGFGCCYEAGKFFF